MLLDFKSPYISDTAKLANEAGRSSSVENPKSVLSAFPTMAFPPCPVEIKFESNWSM